MSHNPINFKGPQVHELDLKKKLLQQQIQKLQKQLKKQERAEPRNNHHGITTHSKHAQSRREERAGTSPTPHQKDSNSASKRQGAHSPRSQLSGKKEKQTKPAISENWKNLFKKDPFFIDSFEKLVKKNSRVDKETLWDKPSLPSKQHSITQFLIKDYYNSCPNNI